VLAHISSISRKRKRVGTVGLSSQAAAVNVATSTAPISPKTAVSAVLRNEDEVAVAGTTSGISTVRVLPTPEQFSSCEPVALYHRIMSEQFAVGQRVRVEFL
jgi:hypothetical protein